MNKRLQAALEKIQKKAAGEEVEEVKVTETTEQPAEEVTETTVETAPLEEKPAEASQSIVDALIGAYCAEKVSEYQYEFACNACKGKTLGKFLSECEDHRQDEHDHADKLAERIRTLHGTIPFTLAEIHEKNPTEAIPREGDNRNTAVLTPQIIKAEEAAVALYQKIADMTKDSDTVTNNIVVDILEVEQNHVYDMQLVDETIKAE